MTEAKKFLERQKLLRAAHAIRATKHWARVIKRCSIESVTEQDLINAHKRGNPGIYNIIRRIHRAIHEPSRPIARR